jgi:hypothetical protein
MGMMIMQRTASNEETSVADSKEDESVVIRECRDSSPCLLLTQAHLQISNDFLVLGFNVLVTMNKVPLEGFGQTILS